MASPNVYTSGIGGTLGASLVTQKPLICSGIVYYVSSLLGSDSNTGKERNRPIGSVQSLQIAVTLAAGDVVVMLAGHSETLGPGFTLSENGVTYVGEGTGSSIPSLIQDPTDTDVGVLVSGTGVRFYNVNFSRLSGSAGTAVPIVKITGAGCVIGTGCTFTQGTDSRSNGLELATGANNCRVEGTTFTSTATTISSDGPLSGIKVTNAISDFTMIDTTFDGGAFGWSHPYAFNGSAAITRLFARGIKLVGDSDVTFATGTTGIYTSTGTGGSNRVVWAA